MVTQNETCRGPAQRHTAAGDLLLTQESFGSAESGGGVSSRREPAPGGAAGGQNSWKEVGSSCQVTQGSSRDPAHSGREAPGPTPLKGSEKSKPCRQRKTFYSFTSPLLRVTEAL